MYVIIDGTMRVCDVPIRKPVCVERDATILAASKLMHVGALCGVVCIEDLICAR